MTQWDVSLAGLGVVEDGVAMAERAASAVLSREAHRDLFNKEGAECEGLGVSPVVGAAVLVRLGAGVAAISGRGPKGSTVKVAKGAAAWKLSALKPGRSATLTLRVRVGRKVTGGIAEAYAKAQLAAGIVLPRSGTAFLSVHDRDKPGCVKLGRELIERGFELVATEGTALALIAAGMFGAAGIGMAVRRRRG